VSDDMKLFLRQAQIRVFFRSEQKQTFEDVNKKPKT